MFDVSGVPLRMSKVTDLEDRRGLGKSERAGLYPPPFLGPSQEIQFYKVRPPTNHQSSPLIRISISVSRPYKCPGSPPCCSYNYNSDLFYNSPILLCLEPKTNSVSLAR